ncbi:MAG: copper-binding protein [Dehalococcoidia bacterium]|nr:MAG: copper-binding protein [Dehalococcoidia bacterium]
MHSIRWASLACAAVALVGAACSSEEAKPAAPTPAAATSTATPPAAATTAAAAAAKPAGPAAVPPLSTPGADGTVKAIISGAKLPTLTVKAGTVVEFVNRDATAHTATSDDGTTFDSGSLAQNETAKFTAGKAGTFAYSCSIHPDMKAFLIVQ